MHENFATAILMNKGRAAGIFMIDLATREMKLIEDLLKNVLRMRPDMIIIGEVRGAEAKDLISAMTIGKIVFGTIHASTTRDIVNRLEQPPMSISSSAITLIDALMVISQIAGDKGFEKSSFIRAYL